jgi:hypothetical protein
MSFNALILNEEYGHVVWRILDDSEQNFASIFKVTSKRRKKPAEAEGKLSSVPLLYVDCNRRAKFF